MEQRILILCGVVERKWTRCVLWGDQRISNVWYSGGGVRQDFLKELLAGSERMEKKDRRVGTGTKGWGHCSGCRWGRSGGWDRKVGLGQMTRRVYCLVKVIKVYCVGKAVVTQRLWATVWLQEDNFINKLHAFTKKDWSQGVWWSGADWTLAA